jgi:hypothetical protein
VIARGNLLGQRTLEPQRRPVQEDRTAFALFPTDSGEAIDVLGRERSSDGSMLFGQDAEPKAR